MLGPLLLGIKSSCWCVTSKVVERGTGCCFGTVDQGVIVALGGWLKDCWVGSPKCGVGRRGGTACGGCGSNYLSKQTPCSVDISSERLWNTIEQFSDI